jgi:hypothetical protein
VGLLFCVRGVPAVHAETLLAARAQASEDGLVAHHRVRADGEHRQAPDIAQ